MQPNISLYKEFLTKLIDSKIDFIILAPYLNRVNPSIGVPLMKRECYLGYGRHLNLSFYNPTAKNKYKTIKNDKKRKSEDLANQSVKKQWQKRRKERKKKKIYKK